ncbi:MAG: retropepsin-like aspartic protease family protein, partial [Geminicoccales bacterium]
MLSWALRYLAMAVAVAIGFAALQGGDWLELPRHERSKSRSVAGAHRSVQAERARRFGSERASAEDWVEPDDQGDAGEVDSWASDDGWDETTPDDDVGAEESDGLLELVIRAGPRGHFVVDAEVEGTPLTFLVDTGASDIVLSQDDARRLGLEPRTLDYSR